MQQFDPSVLPPQPEVIPTDLRHFTADNTQEWRSKVSPGAVGMFIAAVVQWLSAPRFGTKVDCVTEPDGWTIRVSLPKPTVTRDDLMLGNDVD
jgi:hypothetical protein